MSSILMLAGVKVRQNGGYITAVLDKELVKSARVEVVGYWLDLEQRTVQPVNLTIEQPLQSFPQCPVQLNHIRVRVKAVPQNPQHGDYWFAEHSTTVFELPHD